MLLLAAQVGGEDDGATQPPPNVLLIIADDLGVDRVAAYGEHPDPGNTPVIDQLAADGVLFRNAWGNPVCSASRAALLTGRYSFRTGIGSGIPDGAAWELSVDEVSIPDILPPAYRSAAVGKWHLSGSGGTYEDHPRLLGFEHHHGPLANLVGADHDYFNWPKNVDGVVGMSTTYATTDAVDEALALIEEFSAGPEPEPWFMWLAFNASHWPFHHPPDELHSFELPPHIGIEPVFMKAMTEAMDTEIGRLLDAMDPAVKANTVIIFVGDNGTMLFATEPPFIPEQSKNTIFEGGINVPLIVSGRGVAPGMECDALVNTTDIFATVAELVGAVSHAEDSVSMVPYFTDPSLSLRPWVYAELFEPEHTVLNDVRARTVRDRRYKLHRMLGAPADALYNLEADPFEQTDLLADGLLLPAEQAVYAKLSQVLTQLDPVLGNTWFDVGYGLAGTHGVPELSASGELAPGEEISVQLCGALENTLTNLFVGFSFIVAPFKGGTLVPMPDITLALATDAYGCLEINSSWPPGVPPETTLYWQFWLGDPAGTAGVAASNGLTGTTH
jgi:arylsulfatase A-like enzyme